MEIVVRLEPWPEDSPVLHTSTVFYVKDADKNTIITDTTDKLVYVKEIDIPIGDTYYVVAERQFVLKDLEYDISNINYQSEEFPITNNDSEISNMLLGEDVVIETPYIYFNKANMSTSEGSIEVKTSSFKGKGDGHTFTHWIIVSGGEVKFKSLRDNTNKTSIMVPKTVLRNLSNFTIYAVHCSNNIESKMGKLNIVMDSLNFEISSNLVNLPAKTTRIIINRIDKTKAIGLTKIVYKHEGIPLKVIEVNSMLQDDLYYIIDTSIIELKRDIIIELYGNDLNGNVGKKIYKLDIIDSIYTDNTNPDYVYTRLFEESMFDGVLPNGLITDSIGSKIFIPNDSLSFDLCNVDESGIVTISKKLESLNYFGNKTNVFVKYNNDNNTILIDCLDSNDVPTFLVFKHNTFDDTFENVLLKNRTDELYTVGYCNSIEQIDTNRFIYSTYGLNRLRMLDIKEGTITDLAEIPDIDIDNPAILKMDDGNILLFSNKTHHTFIYNIEKNEYRSSMSIPFEELIGKDLLRVDLINGDKLLLVHNSTNGSVGYFDNKKSVLTLLDSKLKIKDSYISYKKYNDIFIAKSTEPDYLTYYNKYVLIEKFI